MNIPHQVLTILTDLEQSGQQARIAGGAVRDNLMGIDPKDYDVATTATPGQVIEIFEKTYKVINTGINHGTVTVMIDEMPIEITTLRKDTNQDGRHADVKFTKDWVMDASRRDFTINAMYMDKNGKIYDYFGGWDALDNRLVQFVGNPIQRMTEDYLRILRFFRFSIKMNHVDLNIIPAMTTCSNGLKNISGERIWSEMKQILTNSNHNQMIDIYDIMYRAGIFNSIGIDLLYYDLPSVQWNKLSHPITKIVYLIKNHSMVSANNLPDRWKFTKKERNLFIFLYGKVFGKYSGKYSLADYKEMCVNGINKLDVIELMNLQGDHSMVSKIQKFNVPIFPITGQDLIQMGHKPGKNFGDMLSSLKRQWVDSDYTLSKQQLLQ